MRNITTLLSGLAVLGAAVLAAPPALADHGDDLEVTATVTHFFFRDTGKEGPSKGDHFRFRASLEDEEGDDAGRSRGGCRLTGTGDGHHKGHDHQPGMSARDHGHDDEELEARCRALFSLEDGRIKIAGTLTRDDFKDDEVVLDIKGGSGDYKDAQGTATIEFLDGHRPGQGHGKGKGHHAHGFETTGHGDGDKDEREAPRFKVTFEFE